jgi:thiosulfate/3-mercaptopyruvate sulfurtransferase
MEEVKDIKEQDNVILLDARPPGVYEGQGPWIKPGHIPGAVNLPWRILMDDKNSKLLKSEMEIKSILNEHNVSPEKTIICSCGTGREATNEFILFKWYFNYPDVKIYEGSFTEWSSYTENPTVTGTNPR